MTRGKENENFYLVLNLNVLKIFELKILLFWDTNLCLLNMLQKKEIQWKIDYEVVDKKKWLQFTKV